MATYHINIRTESHIADSLEVEMDDLTKLRLELARFVGELLKDHAELIWVDEDWRIDVTDEAGAIIYVMHISAVEPPPPVRQPDSRAPVRVGFHHPTLGWFNLVRANGRRCHACPLKDGDI